MLIKNSFQPEKGIYRMKKSELESGMIIQTTHNRFGVIELENNRIDICYDPDSIDKVLEKISLDDIFEYGDGQLGIGCILDKETKENYPNAYWNYEVGEKVIFYEIVAIYNLQQIYYNGEGIYPSIKLQ